MAATATRSNEVLACLDGPASPEQVNQLFERMAAPAEEGRVGRDLLDGVTAVSARTRGVAVEFEPSASPARREEIIAILGRSPVVAVRGSVEGCP